MTIRSVEGRGSHECVWWVVVLLMCAYSIADSRIEHNQPSQCPLCDPIPAHPRQATGEVDGPWHVILECPHERMAVARERMWVGGGFTPQARLTRALR